MRLSSIAAVLASLCWSANASIDSGVFSSLKCAASVGYTYAQGNCNAAQVTDACGKLWKHLYAYNIGDGYGGTITVRLFRRMIDANNGEIYLFFPGSNSPSNFQADFDFAQTSYTFNGICKDCMMHTGFINAFNSAKQTIITTTQYIKNLYPNDNLVVAGGSLGGALAAITYAEFYSNWSYNLFPTGGISFGQPRVGNVAWAAFMNGLTSAGSDNPKWQRVTHGQDTIPLAPPPPSSGGHYYHFGPEIWAVDNLANGNRPNAASTTFCPLGAYGSEPANCINKTPGTGYLPDHVTYPGYGNEAVACPS